MGSPASALFSHIGSAISSATSAGSTALGLSAALRAAADQHQRQVIAQQRQSQLDQQRSMEEEFRNTMQIREHGGTEVPEFNEQKTPEGFVQRTPNPDFSTAQQEGHIVRMPTADGKGKTWHMPDAEEKEPKFIPAGGLKQAFEDHLGITGPIKARDLPHLLQALHEVEPNDTWEPDTSGKYVGPDGKPASMLRSKKTGELKPAQLPEGYGFAPPEKPEKEKPKKNLHFERSTNDAGDVTTNIYDQDTGDVVKTHVEKGIGAKRKDPDAQRAPVLTPGQAAVEKRNIRTAIRNETDRKTDLMRKAEEGFKKEAAAAMGDPAKLQAAKNNLWQAKQQAQNDYEDATRELGQNVEHFDFGQQREGMKGGASQPAPAAKPAAAPQKAASQPVAEGTFIKNPKTGERLMLRGGQWVPASK